MMHQSWAFVGVSSGHSVDHMVQGCRNLLGFCDCVARNGGKGLKSSLISHLLLWDSIPSSQQCDCSFIAEARTEPQSHWSGIEIVGWNSGVWSLHLPRDIWLDFPCCAAFLPPAAFNRPQTAHTQFRKSRCLLRCVLTDFSIITGKHINHMSASNGPTLRFLTCKTENKALHTPFQGTGLLLELTLGLGNGRRTMIRKCRNRRRCLLQKILLKAFRSRESCCVLINPWRFCYPWVQWHSGDICSHIKTEVL